MFTAYRRPGNRPFLYALFDDRFDSIIYLFSGCGSAWLEYLVWDQGVAGSNPVTPMLETRLNSGFLLVKNIGITRSKEVV